MKGNILALLAGFTAALASVCAKLAMAESASLNFCKLALQQIDLVQIEITYITNLEHGKNNISSVIRDCRSVVFYVRVMFFLLIFLCNALMWIFFVKSLQFCSTVEATVINTAANVFFTAILGNILFGEALPLLWWIGASLVVMGLALIHKGSDSASSPEKEKLS